jgi:hypothetical protein
MKARNRCRPTVERLESVNLMSAVPGVAVLPAHDHAIAPQAGLEVTIRGTLAGSLFTRENGYSFFVSGELSINGQLIGADATARIKTHDYATRGGHITFTTDDGTITAKHKFASVFDITSGTGAYDRASGTVAFTSSLDFDHRPDVLLTVKFFP